MRIVTALLILPLRMAPGPGQVPHTDAGHGGSNLPRLHIFYATR